MGTVVGGGLRPGDTCPYVADSCQCMAKKPPQYCNSVQFSSVIPSCPTLCNTMDCSMPGLPVHHQLLELTQTHVHQIGDAIQSSYPLTSASPPALNLSQHQGLFKCVSSSHQLAKVLEFQLHPDSLSNEHSGLISSKIDWLDLLAVKKNICL